MSFQIYKLTHVAEPRYCVFLPWESDFLNTTIFNNRPDIVMYIAWTICYDLREKFKEHLDIINWNSMTVATIEEAHQLKDIANDIFKRILIPCKH